MIPFLTPMLQARRGKKFFQAISEDDFKTVERMLNEGEDINQARKLHPTLALMASPLYAAVSSSSPKKWDMAQFLLVRGADPNGMGAMQTPFQDCIAHIASTRMRLPADTAYTSAPDLRTAIAMYAKGGDINHPAPGQPVQSTPPTNPNANSQFYRDLPLWLEAQLANFRAQQLKNNSPAAVSAPSRPRF